MADSIPEEVKQEADNLAKDLLVILERHDVTISINPEELKDLLVDLSVYLVNREHRILDHGINLGKGDHSGKSS